MEDQNNQPQQIPPQPATPPVQPQHFSPQSIAPTEPLPPNVTPTPNIGMQQPYNNPAPGGFHINIGNQPNYGAPRSTGMSIGIPLFSSAVGGKVAGIFSLLFGLIFVAVGLFIFKQSEIPSNYQTATGNIIQETPQTQSHDNGNGYYSTSTSYFPTIQFKVASNSYQFTSTSGSSSAVPIGSTVQVAYNPSDPGKNPKNASDKSSKPFSLIFAGVGALVAVFGLVRIVKG